MVGDGNADTVGGGGKIVAGVEQPVAAILMRDERALDQMALPIEVVAQDELALADEGAPVVGDALSPDRRRHRLQDRAGEAVFRRARFTRSQLAKGGLDDGLHDEEADHRALLVGPADDRCRKGRRSAGLPRFRTARDQLGFSRRSIASGRGQMPFASSFQNR